MSCGSFVFTWQKPSKNRDIWNDVISSTANITVLLCQFAYAYNQEVGLNMGSGILPSLHPPCGMASPIIFTALHPDLSGVQSFHTS